MAEGKTKRGNDGIPVFDGTPEDFAGYREDALQYLMTFEVRKRYLAGPRLVKELQGSAKAMVRTQTVRDPQWVAHPRRVYTLLDYLEGIVAKPSLVEASRYVMKFFYQLNRRRGETMTSCITRHEEALWEASQSLRRVQKEYGRDDGGNRQYRSTRSYTRRHEDTTRTTHRVPFREDGRLDEDEEDSEEGANASQEPNASDQWWHSDTWNGWSGAWSEWSYHTWRSEEFNPPGDWDCSADIFIPEFLAGFLLLHRSGLDAHERGNILAALRGEFSPRTVATALREQWSDVDLARRDKLKMNAAYQADEQMDDEVEALLADDDEGGVDAMDQECQEAYFNEQDRIEEAMEAIKAHKVTLKEARWKQKQLKLGRKFYPPRPFNRQSKGDGKGAQSSKAGVSCFRCGGPHFADKCPKKEKSANVTEEAAEIAFLGVKGEYEPHATVDTEAALGVSTMDNNYDTMDKIVDGCMGIIDSGATSSLGSMSALQKIMESNIAEFGNSRMEVDIDRKSVV